MNLTQASDPLCTDSGHAPPADTRVSPLGGLLARTEARRATVGVVGLGYVGLPLLAAAGGEGFGVPDRTGSRRRTGAARCRH